MIEGLRGSCALICNSRRNYFDFKFLKDVTTNTRANIDATRVEAPLAASALMISFSSFFLSFPLQQGLFAFDSVELSDVSFARG